MRRSAAAAATCRPARGLPVSDTMATAGWRTMASPTAGPPQHDVEHAGREHVGQQLGHPHRRGGRQLGRLQHHGVAGGHGRRPLPHRHHQRVVPRRDLSAHADRLPADARRHALHVLGGGLAAEQAAGSGEEPDLVHDRRELVLDGGG